MSDLRLLGIRGATTADTNTSEDIYNSTVELMKKLVDFNEID
ncbi:MAG: chorismate mutase, partial [Cyanobacteriota bacterium]